MGGIFSKPKIPDTSAQMKAQADAMENSLLSWTNKRQGLMLKRSQRNARHKHPQQQGAEVVAVIVFSCPLPVAMRPQA